MKKITAILLMVFASLSAMSQTHYKAHISLGAKAGLSLGRIELSPSVPQSWLLASNGALTFRYAEEKLFGLVAEVGWSQRGWNEFYEDSPLEYSRTITYLTIPVMTQIIFGSRRAKCFINLGPQIGFMLAESTKSNYDYFKAPNVPDWPLRQRQTEQLAKPVQNKFDYGIAGGAGFEFYVQPRHSITVEARYYFGLGNIFSARRSDTFSASRLTAIEITLGYNFRLK